MFKKIRLKLKAFYNYHKFLKQNKKELHDTYGISIDWIGRMWVVVNFTDKLEMENIDKYGYPLLDELVVKYVSNLDKFFMKEGMYEFVALDNVDRIEKYSVLVVINFSLFDLSKIIKKTLKYLILGGIITASYFIFF